MVLTHVIPRANAGLIISQDGGGTAARFEFDPDRPVLTLRNVDQNNRTAVDFELSTPGVIPTPIPGGPFAKAEIIEGVAYWFNDPGVGPGVPPGGSFNLTLSNVPPGQLFFISLSYRADDPGPSNLAPEIVAFGGGPAPPGSLRAIGDGPVPIPEPASLLPFSIGAILIIVYSYINGRKS